ncbi:MAG TPA: hypothetical protein VM328_13160 [Fimbriimonadaceae bacterium]|nr:hypothetical protein [Fimbriimonadaceae bacterium]
MEEIIAELSSVAGVQLSVASPLSEGILFLKVDAQPLRDVAENVAHAVHGRWRASDRVIVLAREQEQWKDLEDQERAAFLERISNEIRAVEAARRNGNAYEAYQQILRSFQSTSPDTIIETPQGLLIKDVLCTFSGDDLSRLPLGVPVVYSDKPNAFEYPLPQGASSAVLRYIQVEDLLQQEEVSQFKNTGLVEWWRVLVKGFGTYGRTLLIVIRSQSDIWLSLGTYTAEGELRGTATFSVRLDRQPYDLPTIKGLGKFHLSELSSTLLAPYSKAGSPRQLARRLEGLEPLDHASKEAVDAIATRVGVKSISAYLDDEWHDILHLSTSEGTVDLDVLASLLSARGTATFERRGAWLLVLPGHHLKSERARLLRGSLGRFIRHAMSEGSISARNYAVLRFETSRYAMRGSLFRWFRETLRGSESIDLPQGIADSVAAFVGSLTDVQWDALLRGRTMSVGSLSTRSQSLFRAWASESLRACIRHRGDDGIPDLMLTGTQCLGATLTDVVLKLEKREGSIIRFVKLPETLASSVPADRLLDPAFLRDRMKNLHDEGVIASERDLDEAVVDIGTSTNTMLLSYPRPGISLSACFADNPRWSSRGLRVSQLSESAKSLFFGGWPLP